MDLKNEMPVIVKGHNRQGTVLLRTVLVYYICNFINDNTFDVKVPVGLGGVSGVTKSDIKIANKKQELESLNGMLNLSKRNLERVPKEEISDLKKDITDLENLINNF